VRLNPGIYIFEDGLQVGAGSTITGDVNNNGTLDPSEQVLLYSTCSLPAPCNATSPARTAGDITFSGSSVVRLRGLSSMQEMVIWVDRTSGGAPIVDLGGNSGAQGLQGRIYNLHGDVEVRGSGSANLTLNMSIVAGTIHFQGTATFN